MRASLSWEMGTVSAEVSLSWEPKWYVKEMGVWGEKGRYERLPALGAFTQLETVSEFLRKNIYCVERNTQLSLHARLLIGWSFFPPSWSHAVSSCVSRHGDVTEYALLHTLPVSRQQALLLFTSGSLAILCSLTRECLKGPCLSLWQMGTLTMLMSSYKGRKKGQTTAQDTMIRELCFNGYLGLLRPSAAITGE